MVHFPYSDLPAQALVAVYTLQEKRKTRWNPPWAVFGDVFWGSDDPQPPHEENEKHHFDPTHEVYSQSYPSKTKKKNIQKTLVDQAATCSQKKTGLFWKLRFHLSFPNFGNIPFGVVFLGHHPAIPGPNPHANNRGSKHHSPTRSRPHDAWRHFFGVEIDL